MRPCVSQALLHPRSQARLRVGVPNLLEKKSVHVDQHKHDLPTCPQLRPPMRQDVGETQNVPRHALIISRSHGPTERWNRPRWGSRRLPREHLFTKHPRCNSSSSFVPLPFNGDSAWSRTRHGQHNNIHHLEARVGGWSRERTAGLPQVDVGTHMAKDVPTALDITHSKSRLECDGLVASSTTHESHPSAPRAAEGGGERSRRRCTSPTEKHKVPIDLDSSHQEQQPPTTFMEKRWSSSASRFSSRHYLEIPGTRTQLQESTGGDTRSFRHVLDTNAAASDGLRQIPITVRRTNSRRPSSTICITAVHQQSGNTVAHVQLHLSRDHSPSCTAPRTHPATPNSNPVSYGPQATPALEPPPSPRVPPLCLAPPSLYVHH